MKRVAEEKFEASLEGRFREVDKEGEINMIKKLVKENYLDEDEHTGTDPRILKKMKEMGNAED